MNKPLNHQWILISAVYALLSECAVTFLLHLNPSHFTNSCTFRYSEDESWYRAKVLAQQEERVLVHFYDYGNFDIVPAADLHPLPSSLRQMPPAALQCSLSGLSPVEDDWNSDVCHRFSELCSNKKLLAEAISVQEAKPDTEQFFYVKLLDLGCSIGAKLLEEQLAVEGDTPPPKSLETSGETDSKWGHHLIEWYQ